MEKQENEELATGALSHLSVELGTTSDEPKKEQYSLRGFGTTFEVQTGRSRKWYFVDGVKRWADNDEPCCA